MQLYIEVARHPYDRTKPYCMSKTLLPHEVPLPSFSTQSTCTPAITSPPNLLLNLPSPPFAFPSSSPSSPSASPLAHTAALFHIGWFVTSRVSRINDRGEVVQCVNVEPSERMTC